MKNKIILYVSVILLILGLTFFGGYRYYGSTHQIVTQTDTILIYDTIIHEIPNDVHHYHVDIDTVFVPDSILIPSDVDTLAILADYYRIYNYKRAWEDSVISVTFTDQISQNRIFQSSLLQYKLLKPQTVITNTTTINNYSTYLNLGLNSDIKFLYPEITAQLITKKFSYGVGYMPVQKGLTIHLGYNILKIK